MPLGTLQSFADNLRPGLDSLGELIAQLQAKKAAGANVNSAMADQGSGQPLTAPAVPGPKLPAGLAAIAGGAPQGTPGQPPSIPTGPVPQGASFGQAFSPQGQQSPPPGGSPQQQPPSPLQQPPRPDLSSTAQPDAAGMDDPLKAGQQSLYTIIRGIKASNPGISNTTLMAAVHQQLDDIKGVAPLTKIAMQAQLQTLKLQVDAQNNAARQQHAHDMFMVAWQNANTRAKQQAALEAYQQALDGPGGIYDRRIDLGYAGVSEHATAAAGHDATTLKATQMRDKAMQDRANSAATAALDREIARSKGTERNALIAAKAKVAAALLGSFQKGDIGGEADAIVGGGDDGGQPSPSTASIMPRRASVNGGPSAPSAPKPGTIVSGYTFKGGDPSDRANWARAGANRARAGG